MSEHQHREYKSAWRDEYLKWVSGFANSRGGKLYVGVNDEGNVVGVQNSKALLEQLPNKFRDLLGVYAEVNLLEKDKKSYIEIVIPHYEVPISYRGKYYVRSGSTLQELKGVALNEFILKKMGKSWESVSEEDFSLEDIDVDTVDRFKRLASDRLPSVSTEKDISVILDKLNLRERGVLNRAAILLFGKDVQRRFLQARVKVGRFVSDTDLVSSDIVEGNLFHQLETTLDTLRAKYLISPITYEGIHRREKLEIPYEALREALINALIHRTYATTSSIQIKVTDTTVELMNEGSLPTGMQPEDLKKTHLSRPRNRLLADVFYKGGLIESWGRGTLKVIEACKKAGFPEPVFGYKWPFFLYYVLQDGKNRRCHRRCHRR